MEKVLEFLKSAGTYYLATVEGDKPHVRPFGTIEFIDGALCFQTGKSKPTSRQIHDNPKVEICAFDGDSWIRVQALAIEDPRVESQEKMLDAYPELKGMYAPGDGNTEIFKLIQGVATISSFSAAPITIKW